MARLAARLLALCLCATADQLTPAEQQVISGARNASLEASAKAEQDLVAQFESTSFRLGLQLQGASGRRLASLSSQQLMEQLKVALQSLEWVTNFGLDAESLKAHPGDSAFSIKTLQAFNGRFPTMWELRASNSSIVANVSSDQWGIMEAAETGLYGLPPFKTTVPTPQEARERPRYLAGNTRQLAMGVRRYGAMSAVLRNDVVRRRAVILGSDSGGWESVCNKSVTPVHKPSWFMKIVEDLSVPCEPVQKTPLGVADMYLHSFLANSQTFHTVGGGLARSVYQLLARDADVRPLEGNMYMEAALLGEMRVDDVKLLVGSFPGLFGSELGVQLRNFCAHHQVPLAWSLGDGQEWTREEQEKLHWLPWEPFEFWHSDGGRLLDPIAGWPHTSRPSLGGGAKLQELWKQVWDEVQQHRAELAEKQWLGQGAVKAWWLQIAGSDLPVPMLQGTACPADLCFGTVAHAGKQTCICRASELVV